MSQLAQGLSHFKISAKKYISNKDLREWFASGPGPSRARDVFQIHDRSPTQPVTNISISGAVGPARPPIFKYQ